MIGYFKLSFNILIHKALFNILIIIEIAAMLILTNIVVSSYNGKTFLYEPYKDLLDNDGVVCELDLAMGYGNTNEDISAIIEKYNYLHFPSLISLLKERLSGSVDIIYTRYYWLGDESGLRSDSPAYSDIQMIGVDPYIFSKLKLPLSSGRWASSDITNDGIAEAVISGGTSAELGHVYKTDVGKVRIVGILEDSTYIPPGIDVSDDSGRKLSIFDHYVPYDCNASLRAPFILMDRNVYDKIISEDDPNYGKYFFISYGNVDEETVTKNNEYLQSIGAKIRSQVGNENFDTLVSETKKELNNIYLRMLPIIITAFVVILIGLTGSMSMSVCREMRTYGIFYLCGCNWKNCRRIISAQILMMFSLSVIIAAAILLIMQIMNIDYVIGTVYRMNNLYFSTAELVLMYFLSLFIPKRLIKTASPVETIKEQ